MTRYDGTFEARIQMKKEIRSIRDFDSLARGAMRIPFAPFASHKLVVRTASYSENGMRRRH
jgi:hypothetical protein